jgi:hypothetical protein
LKINIQYYENRKSHKFHIFLENMLAELQGDSRTGVWRGVAGQAKGDSAMSVISSHAVRIDQLV